MKRGIVTVNDDRKVRVEFKDGSWVEHWKGDHRPEQFTVGMEVSCSASAIYMDATTGHTFLVVDWKEPFPGDFDEFRPGVAR